MEDSRLFRKCLHDQSAATVENVGVCMCEGRGVSPHLVYISVRTEKKITAEFPLT